MFFQSPGLINFVNILTGISIRLCDKKWGRHTLMYLPFVVFVYEHLIKL